jgi:heptosyltransferase-1
VSAVLVVRPSSLGDVVHALALVADIRRAQPATQVDWVAEETFADLPRMHADVRTVVPVALRRWRDALLAAGTWREFAAFRHALRQQRYATVLDLQEQVKGALIARMAHGTRHGLHPTSIREPVATLLHDVHHRIERNVHFITKCRTLAAAALGYRVEGPPQWHWRLPAPPAALPPGPFVVFITATSRLSKLWPEAHWRELAARITGSGYAVVLPWGSAGEEARCRRIADAVPGATLLPRQPLPALAALLARAEYVVGVDTGLTHLAAALRTLTVAVFTDTDAALAGVAICGEHAQDVGGNGDVPTVAAVEDALGRLQQLHPSC